MKPSPRQAQALLASPGSPRAQPSGGPTAEKRSLDPEEVSGAEASWKSPSAPEKGEGSRWEETQPGRQAHEDRLVQRSEMLCTVL